MALRSLPCHMGTSYLARLTGYSPEDLSHHRNWALRGGETQGVSRGSGKTSAGFSKRADLGIIRTPLLQLALRTSGIAHSHTLRTVRVKFSP